MRTKLVLLGLVILLGQAGAQMPATLTVEEKVYGLSHFWREATYNFAYFYKTPELNWDSAYQAFLPRVMATTDDYAYYRELQRFCALLKDGHTNVYFPQAIDNQLMGNSFHPYRFMLGAFGGRVYVTNATMGTVTDIPLGSEVVAVNGMPTDVWMQEEVMPYIASSTDHILFDWAAGNLLRGPVGGQISVAIRTPAGEERQFVLTRGRSSSDWAKPMRNFKNVELRWPEPGVAQLILNTFDDKAVDSVFQTLLPELRKSRAVIIDLRNNGGGSTEIGANVLKYFVDRDTLVGSRWATRQHRAAYKAWGVWTTAQDTIGDDWAKEAYLYARGQVWYTGERHEALNDVPADQRLRQPMVVLIEHNTASAAEDFLIFLDGLNRAKVIGRPTFGSTGQPLSFELPGGAYARICTKKDTYADGREFVGYGIQPDVRIEPTIEEYLNDKDAALEAALRHLKQR